MAGKNLIKEIEEIHQLLIYEIKAECNFSLLKKVDLPEDYRSFSKITEFAHDKQDKAVLLIDRSRIVRYHFMEETAETIYKFEN